MRLKAVSGAAALIISQNPDLNPDVVKALLMDSAKPLPGATTAQEGAGALNLTLQSVFNKPAATTGWILYNDEKPVDVPGNDNGELGHTKGVLAFDTRTKSGYWLLHSWPKYAEPKAKADPTPMYGQTYLCLSLDLATLEQIAAQMIDSWCSALPAIAAAQARLAALQNCA